MGGYILGDQEADSGDEKNVETDGKKFDKEKLGQAKIFIFALLTCLVPVKVNHYQYKLFPFLVKSFPAFSGRNESRDLICIRHTYQNDKICKPIGLPNSYDTKTKALENRPPSDF